MFLITIQLPFEQNEIQYPDRNREEAVALYASMNWPALAQEVYERQGAVLNDYYFFEISRSISGGQKELLHVSGYVDALIGLDYVRPKWVKKGLFIKKEVLDPEYRTHLDAMPVTFGNDCFQAFLRGDADFLERSVSDKNNN